MIFQFWGKFFIFFTTENRTNKFKIISRKSSTCVKKKQPASQIQNCLNGIEVMLNLNGKNNKKIKPSSITIKLFEFVIKSFLKPKSLNGLFISAKLENSSHASTPWTYPNLHAKNWERLCRTRLMFAGVTSREWTRKRRKEFRNTTYNFCLGFHT